MSAKIRLPASIAFLLVMTVLTGVLYPLVVTGLAQALFPKKANGSLLVIGGGVRGSTLLAQKFESPGFFKARPSASDYVWVGAGASNMALTNPDLATTVAKRRSEWAATFSGPAPADMLYASASGLDPDISLEAALAQVDSVAAARGMGAAAKDKLIAAIRAEAEANSGLLGPPRVNVVKLDAALLTDPTFATPK